MENNLNVVAAERGGWFHRNREQPAPDPNEPPINQIKFYLDRYRIKEALQIFFEENTLRLLRVESDFMWDIIPLICKRLRGLCQYRFRVFEGCERMLCRIAVDVNCNPKEVLISLLAELSLQGDCEDDNVFRAMIRPLEGTLLRMNYPSPREENLRWVLNVLIRHINNIELPQEYNLEEKKRLSLPNDPSVKRYIEILPLLLSFIEEFNERPIDFYRSPLPILTESQIDEVFNGELDDDLLMNELNYTRSVRLNASVMALMSLMSKPLTFLDLTSNCTELRIFSDRCLSTLLKLKPNLFSPIYKSLSDNSQQSATEIDIFACNSSSSRSSFCSNGGEFCNETTLSLATCLYLYRCEKSISTSTTFDETMYSLSFFPLVITHESTFSCHVPYIVTLLERSEILVHEKGLLLLENLLQPLEHDSLDEKFLNLIDTTSLHKQLFRIMVYSPLGTNRRKAYNMFTSLCDLLTYDCKLKMFNHVLTQNDLRPCVRALSIDQYRKHLTNAYRELLIVQDQNVMKRYRSIGGQALVDFLDLCINACLPDSHTDVIENYELLLATLTMLRFLRLRSDSVRDNTEEEYLRKLKKSFFEPIRNAIALIKSELKLHQKETNGTDEDDCLNWSLCRLDLVESVLVRTCDLFDCHETNIMSIDNQ